MINLGERLRSIRKDRGISSYQLEFLSGITQATISRIENNKHSPSIDTLLKICNALEISIIDLLFEIHDELPDDMINLINTAKQLTPQQRKKVTEMLQSFFPKN